MCTWPTLDTSPLLDECFESIVSQSFPSFSFYFKKLLIIDYATIVVPIFPPRPPSTQHPQSLRQSPHHCSCPWVMHISSLATSFPILYFISPRLFCNYQFVLFNPLTSHPFSQSHPIWQPSKHSLYP